MREFIFIRLYNMPLHKRLKVEAAKRGETIAQMVEKAILLYLRKAVDK